MNRLAELSQRVDRLEKEAGFLDFLSKDKREIRDEERELEARFMREPGIDRVEVEIEREGKATGAEIAYDMRLSVIYEGRRYELEGYRLVSLKRGKRANPLMFGLRRDHSSPSYERVEQEVAMSERVRYRIFSPEDRRYEIKVFPKGHRFYERSESLSSLVRALS